MKTKEDKTIEAEVEVEGNLRTSSELAISRETSPALIDNSPMAMLAVANASNAPIERLEKLMDFQERFEANEARKAFSRAMAKFTGLCPVVHKAHKAHNSQYASLEDIQLAIRPALNECELSVRFTSTMAEGNLVSTCHVTHADGHGVASEFTVPVDAKMAANDSQKLGAANTYAKRYALCNALGIMSGDTDDDGVSLGEAAAAADPVTSEQLAQLTKYLGGNPKRVERMCNFFSVEKITNLDTIQAAEAILLLSKKA